MDQTLLKMPANVAEMQALLDAPLPAHVAGPHAVGAMHELPGNLGSMITPDMWLQILTGVANFGFPAFAPLIIRVLKFVFARIVPTAPTAP